MAVTFDLFGTLVSVDRPDDPARAVGRELDARGIAVPDDWAGAYRERHVEAPEGAAVPLPAHVSAALRSRGVDPTGPTRDDGDPEGTAGAGGNLVRRAVVSAFDPSVTTREGAPAAVAAAAERGPVGVCSNCAVPELARRALIRSSVDRDAFDAVVTSAGCGWRKPHRRAFGAAARGLGVAASDLVHVGDDPRTDGGIGDAGGTFVHVDGGDRGVAEGPAAGDDGTVAADAAPAADLDSLSALVDRLPELD